MAATESLKDSGEMPEQGKWYRLLADFGEGAGMLTKSHAYRAPGAEEDAESDRMLLVLAVVEPSTHGVGYSGEDSVLAMWLRPSGPGRLSAHHLSLPLSQFIEMVGEGEVPPEYADWKAQQAAGEG